MVDSIAMLLVLPVYE